MTAPLPRPAGIAPALLFAAVALLALVAPAHITQRESYWYDECLTLEVMASGAWWEDYVATESSPPAYFALARFLHLLGAGWMGAARAISIVAGAAAVMMFAAWAWRRAGPCAGSAAGALALLHPFGLWYAAEARPYALLLLAATGLTLAVADLAPTDAGAAGDARAARRLAVRFAGWATLALLTHYFAALLVGVASCAWLALLLLAPAATPTRLRHYLAAHVPLLVVGPALAFLLHAQEAGGHTEYIPPATLKDLGRTFLVVFPFGLDAALWRPLRLAGAAGVACLLALAALRLAPGGRRKPRRGAPGSRFAAAAVLALLLAPSLLLFGISVLVRPVYLYDRYPIMSLPALWVLAALVLRADGALQHRRPAAGVAAAVAIGLLLLAAGVQWVRYLGRDEPLRTDWRQLARRLVVLDSGEVRPPVVCLDEETERCLRHNLAPGAPYLSGLGLSPRPDDGQEMDFWIAHATFGVVVGPAGALADLPSPPGYRLRFRPLARSGDIVMGRLECLLPD